MIMQIVLYDEETEKSHTAELTPSGNGVSLKLFDGREIYVEIYAGRFTARAYMRKGLARAAASARERRSLCARQ
jgi:hypothetical protein